MQQFDPAAFVEECKAALDETDRLAAVTDVVARAVSAPDAVADTIQFPLDPDDEGILYRSDELLVLQVVFPAQFVTGIHDHRVPAVIGAWAGYEDNLLYRRTEDGRLYEIGSRRIEPAQVLVMQTDQAHDVHAPVGSWTGGLHVYLGDMLARPRSGWTEAGAEERPFDGEAMGANWDRLARSSGLVRGPA